MSALPTLVHDAALAAGIGALLYSATVTTAALTALLAPTPQRRRDARAVLTILVRRPRTAGGPPQ
jgi:hypothetical protein